MTPFVILILIFFIFIFIHYLTYYYVLLLDLLQVIPSKFAMNTIRVQPHKDQTPFHTSRKTTDFR
jgi:hypothetical protein